MEQKRVLWIVVAVGLFLLVVIGAALLFYNPVQNTTKLTALEGNGSLWINTDGRTATVYTSEDPVAPPTNSSTQTSTQTDTAETVVHNLTVLAENTFVYSSNTNTSTTDATTQTIDVVAPKTETEANKNKTTPSPAPVPAVTEKKTAETKTTAGAAATSKNTKTTAATSSGSETSAVKTTSDAVSTAKTTTVKTVTKKAEDSFFVQVGSFTSKKNAEDARTLLTDEKIPAEIFTWKNDKGTVFYRLRVGPYKTKTEANYWLSRIKLIDGFAAESAYVVNSPATEE